MFVAINVPVANSSTTFASSDQFEVFLTKIYLVAVESSPLPPEEPSQIERIEVENEGIDETPPQIQRKRNRKTCTFPVKSKCLTRQSVKTAVKAAFASSTAIADGRNDHFVAVSSSKDMDGVIDLRSLDVETMSSESTDKDAFLILSAVKFKFLSKTTFVLTIVFFLRAIHQHQSENFIWKTHMNLQLIPLQRILITISILLRTFLLHLLMNLHHYIL
jgi:hypothetical protein